ncbi:SPTSB palmitoyltransferase, partial [Polyodon spathula]|nr:SPTSB palmitoyltransferase [Polyodon spathula]
MRQCFHRPDASWFPEIFYALISPRAPTTSWVSYDRFPSFTGFLVLRSYSAVPPPCASHCNSMDVKGLKEYLSWLYYQYLLVTCSYVLEPWEQSIFNTLLFTMVTMVVYTAYVFIPIHTRLALEFFSGLFGGQHESTAAFMS